MGKSSWKKEEKSRSVGIKVEYEDRLRFFASQKSFGGRVPETGFEPARRFQRYHLKVVRLPISPPGQNRFQFSVFCSPFSVLSFLFGVTKVDGPNNRKPKTVNCNSSLGRKNKRF